MESRRWAPFISLFTFFRPILTLCLWAQSDDAEDDDNTDSLSESDTEGADLSHVSIMTEDEEEEPKNQIFLKCKISRADNIDRESEEEGVTKEAGGNTEEKVEPKQVENIEEKLEGKQVKKTEEKEQQSELTLEKIEKLFDQEEEQQKEIKVLLDTIKKLEMKGNDQVKAKVMRLESQNSVLKEKSSDIRNENDMLVAKIQKLQSRLSQEVRVSVSDYDEGDPDDIFNLASSPRPSSISPDSANGSRSRIKVSVTEDCILNDEKRFEEAAEKIMRLEQRVICLQNANNVNSCATCRPLRTHVQKIERQLQSLAQERRGQLEELYELKQEALSSAVSEKDAHLQWLEVAGEGSSNVHTRGTIDRLRKERRELLNRMKEENEKRMTLLSALEDSSSSIFTGPGKMSTLGSLHRGDSILDAESPGVQSTSSLQSASTGDGEEPDLRCLIPLVTDPRESRGEDEDCENQSSKRSNSF